MDLALFDVFDETDTSAGNRESVTAVRAPKRARSDEDCSEETQPVMKKESERGAGEEGVEGGEEEEVEVEEIEQPVTVFTEHTEHDSNRSSTLTTVRPPLPRACISHPFLPSLSPIDSCPPS